MKYYQKEITLPAYRRGFHLITAIIEKEIPEIREIDIGLLHILIKLTFISFYTF